MIINEELIYYIWATKNFDTFNLTTWSGEPVQIIHFGHRNFSSGPDFLNAKIKIGDVLWAGNVEMHVLTSDWIKHRHDDDPAYKNVILHVVFEHDLDLARDIPTLQMKSLIKPNIMHKYQSLMDNTYWIPCEKIFNKESAEKINLWKHSLITSRLEQKTKTISLEKSYLNGDWEQLIYEQVAKYFGGKENSECFETLAKKLPLSLIQKNRHNSHHLEALIFGMAGFLEDMVEVEDSYYQNLKVEFDYLKKKYGLVPMDKVQWRNFGMYASGLPTFRLAQFAVFIGDKMHLFSSVLDATQVRNLYQIIISKVEHSYWQKHYVFGKSTDKVHSIGLSTDMANRLIINAIIPTLFLFGKSVANEDIIERTIEFLYDMKAEDNTIIQKWRSLGVTVEHCGDTQALIELKTKYCDAKLCLSCQVGHHILQKN
jgi:hypothetical protein